MAQIASNRADDLRDRVKRWGHYYYTHEIFTLYHHSWIVHLFVVKKKKKKKKCVMGAER